MILLRKVALVFLRRPATLKPGQGLNAMLQLISQAAGRIFASN